MGHAIYLKLKFNQMSYILSGHPTNKGWEVGRRRVMIHAWKMVAVSAGGARMWWGRKVSIGSLPPAAHPRRQQGCRGRRGGPFHPWGRGCFLVVRPLHLPQLSPHTSHRPHCDRRGTCYQDGGRGRHREPRLGLQPVSQRCPSASADAWPWQAHSHSQREQ